MATVNEEARPAAPGLLALVQGPPVYQPVTAWGPFSALAVTVVAYLGPLILLSLASILATVVLAPGYEVRSRLNDLSSLSSPVGVAALILSQLFTLWIVWLAAARGGRRTETLRLAEPQPTWTTAVAVSVLLIIVTGALEPIIYWLFGTELFGDSGHLMDGLRSEVGLAVIFIAVVLAPLSEELMFRGFLLSALAKSPLGFWPAALISTTLWTLLHWGYSNAGLVSVFVAGILLSWLMQRLGSMRVVVVAHALANAVSLAAAWLFVPVG